MMCAVDVRTVVENQATFTKVLHSVQDDDGLCHPGTVKDLILCLIVLRDNPTGDDRNSI